MNKWLKRILWGISIIVMMIVGFIGGRNGANDTIDSAQATSAALENSLNELLNVTQPPDLSGELATLSAANLTIAAHNSEQMTAAAKLQVTEIPPTTDFTQTAAALFTAVVTPTSTSTPTLIPNCYPTNIIEVVAVRVPSANLRDGVVDADGAFNSFGVYIDGSGNRIKYSAGTTFFVLEEALKTDYDSIYYQVFGPLGHGLFVRGDHIKLFNDNPDLVYCN